MTTRPIYVVQLHQATHLHHDFRLEVDGVLVSWAVPKGPSQEPGVKRLAVRVDDHELAHADVEGPQERGWVEIWDRGTFEVLSDLPAQEALAEGHLTIRLHGDRLDDLVYTLRRTRLGGDDRNWIMFRSGRERPDI